MVKIVTDTTSSLPDAIVQRYNIPVIPQIINFGTESFREGIEIDNATFLHRLKTESELPTTAAPPPEMFVEVFEQLVSAGDSVLCLHPSAQLSGTVRFARVAAAEFPTADIRVIDTRVIASPLATLVQLAAEWAAAEMDADTIEARVCEMMDRARVYFMVDTLEFLAKGGRIGGAAALLGGLLRIKPILTLRDGQVDQFGRERTHKAGVARLKALVQVPREKPSYLSVVHAGVPVRAQALAGDLRERLGLDRVPVYDVPPAIVTHAGPGLLGVAFFV